MTDRSTHGVAFLFAVSLVTVALGCGEPAASATPATTLRALIEDVRAATAYRYGLRDDLGHEMDGVKVIAIPESGGFVGLYHSHRASSFFVHLATSTDLLDWTWRVQLATDASMPTIKPATDDGYVVAWEQEPDNHLLFAFYPSWPDLLTAMPTKTFEPGQQLSDCAEGTPNLYSASSNFLDVGFHFYDDCDTDRQARGTTDWTTFDAAPRPDLEEAVRANGVEAGVGDRDVIDFEGSQLTLVEGMSKRDDWRTWRVYLYDPWTGIAEPLDIRSHAGARAFTNPTIERIEIDGRDAIVVSLFVPQENGIEAETGELLYYRVLEP